MRIVALALLSVLLTGWTWWEKPPPLPSQPVKPVLMSECHASGEGIAIIESYEGYVPFVYKDVAGLATIGFGHLVRPGEKFKQPLLPEDAKKLLQADARKITSAMNPLIKPALHQMECDALISFTFNLGPGALAGSTLLKRVNAGRHAEVPPQFLVWNKARVNGVLIPVPGLLRRRTTESELYGRGTAEARR